MIEKRNFELETKSAMSDSPDVDDAVESAVDAFSRGAGAGAGGQSAAAASEGGAA